ncbi:succinate-semialdehyde dehydrogenase / glutarate-semialdehyde dehydrogenase [Nitrosomonas sp. Nm33]|nr:succinate-semialdehyde dehydrogenase / glutarate-semialdehyde dehydrogenase [Nitrosomonas sp. Nm33]
MVGNVLLLKHAESVPQSALAFARLFEEAGAPAGVYANIFASIEQTERLIEDPRVRGVTLTGSERAGAAVAGRAGRSLKKSVMELGGSDPLIVLEDAPMESTLDNALFGRMFNTGQCCVGSKRIIVIGKERGEDFLDGFVQRIAALKAGDPADPATTLGPLASEKALDLLLDQIKLARKEGGKVAFGGGRIDRPGFYLEPTVLTGISENNPIHVQELFGPIASFYVVENENEAVSLANATPFGLGASVFTADVEHGRKVAAKIESGMVFINQPVWTAAQLPFGGIKNSGFGRELSELGFGEFVNEKLINVAPPGSPPWGPIK